MASRFSKLVLVVGLASPCKGLAQTADDAFSVREAQQASQVESSIDQVSGTVFLTRKKVPSDVTSARSWTPHAVHAIQLAGAFFGGRGVVSRLLSKDIQMVQEPSPAKSASRAPAESTSREIRWDWRILGLGGGFLVGVAMTCARLGLRRRGAPRGRSPARAVPVSRTDGAEMGNQESPLCAHAEAEHGRRSPTRRKTWSASNPQESTEDFDIGFEPKLSPRFSDTVQYCDGFVRQRTEEFEKKIEFIRIASESPTVSQREPELCHRMSTEDFQIDNCSRMGTEDYLIDN